MKKTTPLHNIFRKQQPKIQATERKAALLKTFAEDDYKRIAVLIKKWLDADEAGS